MAMVYFFVFHVKILRKNAIKLIATIDANSDLRIGRSNERSRRELTNLLATIKNSGRMKKGGAD